MEELDYMQLGKCFAKILESDRSNINSFHEDFVCALADFGFTEFISVDEMKWYQESVVEGVSGLSIDDYNEDYW